MDNQTQLPQQESAVVAAQHNEPLVGSQQKPTRRSKKVLVVLLFVLLLTGVGFLGYTYKMTNDSLKKKSQDLSSAYGTIEKFQAIINSNQAEKDFIAKNNTALLSRSTCNGKPLLMSDIHLTNKYAVFRYLCADFSAPIRIGSMQKSEDGTYKFTYGDGTAQTNRLPSYIYDDDPTFFAIYGVTRF